MDTGDEGIKQRSSFLEYMRKQQHPDDPLIYVLEGERTK